MDKIRKAYINDDLADLARCRFPGLGDIELSVSDIVELMEDVYKSRDEEIKKLEAELQDVKIQCNSYAQRLARLGEDDLIWYGTALKENEKISQVTWDLLPEDKKALKIGQQEESDV